MTKLKLNAHFTSQNGKYSRHLQIILSSSLSKMYFNVIKSERRFGTGCSLIIFVRIIFIVIRFDSNFFGYLAVRSIDSKVHSRVTNVQFGSLFG